MFRTKQASLKSPFTFFAFAGEKFSELYQQKEIRDLEFFLDQATPGFELGKKDLQSPALPLGHAAKKKCMIPYKIAEKVSLCLRREGDS